MSVQGLDEFLRPLDEEPAMRRWAEATQRRLHESLDQGVEPGTGAPLAPNAPSTVKRKGRSQPGVDTGELQQALLDPATIGLRVGGSDAEAVVTYEIGTGNPKSESGPLTNAQKLAVLIGGREARMVTKKARRPNGSVKTWKKDVPPQPARDFVGVDERDVEAAAEDVLGDICRQLGFQGD